VEFRYFIIHRDRNWKEPRGLFVVNAEAMPFETVSYNHIFKRWAFDPTIVDYLIGEKVDRAEEATRARAEEAARSLGLSIPTENELKRIIETSTTGTPDRSDDETTATH
jgi:hypothetical protein